jgi:hypothetical protein
MADLDVVFDQSQGQLQYFEVVRDECEIVLADVADVVGLLVERTRVCFSDGN